MGTPDGDTNVMKILLLYLELFEKCLSLCAQAFKALNVKLEKTDLTILVARIAAFV